jgi:class 3 adenylate cyclase
MTVDQGGTITRGFLFADLRGYTDFVEERGAAAAATLLKSSFHNDAFLSRR